MGNYGKNENARANERVIENVIGNTVGPPQKKKVPATQQDGQSSLSKVDSSWIENEIMTLMALAYYRLRRFDESLSCSKNVLEKAIDPAQKCRAQFYHAASLPPKETELRKTEHMKVLNDIDHAIQKGEINDSIRLELLKVKSEALNNLGFILLFGLKKPNDALIYFKEAAELNEIPEINDQKGIGISHGGMGDCYKAQGELSSAEDEYKINLKISTENGDIQGVCRMNSMLGQICLNKASLANEPDDELFSRASNYYEDSLKAAVSQNNGVNIAFALAGIIEVCLASKNYTSFDYVFEELGRFIDSGLCKSIPDFARTPLKESMQTIKAISPELEEKANGYIKDLD